MTIMVTLPRIVRQIWCVFPTLVVATALGAQDRGCNAAFADSSVHLVVRALNRVAAVPPVWDNYTLARHPVLLIADSTYSGRPKTPVCAAIWRANVPLSIMEIAARPRSQTPLYGMMNIDAPGPRAIDGADALISDWRSRLTPPVAQQLGALGLMRAVFLPVPVNLEGLGAFGAMLKQQGADPVLMLADLAVHESFHLHSQFPKWLDQHADYAWPAWDQQPSRRELRERCYAQTPQVAAALQSEFQALIAAFDKVSSDSSRDYAGALADARRFVALRAARRELLSAVTVTEGNRQISCEVAENIMELEEGTSQWIGHATTVRAGLASLARWRSSYGGTQAEAFYRSGPLQLWVLERLLGSDAVHRITESIARSTSHADGVFGQFERATRMRAER